jgi:transporter, SSS family
METLLALGIYFAIIILIGFLSYRKMHTESAFVMGNRSLNFWLTALSAHSSDMSAWLFLAFPGAIYLHGVGQTWIAVGLILGMWANWHFIAPKLRVATENYQSYTLSTFFERRFNDTSGIIRLLSGLLALVFLTAYLTAGIVGMGILIESLFGINYILGILIMMPILITYVSYGGFITVAWVDFFQGMFLFAVALIVPIVAWNYIGGWPVIEAAAIKNGISLSFWSPDDRVSNICKLLMGLGWGLGYFGQPHILTKFMGIRDPKELVKSKYLGMSWQVISLTGALFIGLVAIGFFPDRVDNHEMVFIHMVHILFNPFVATFMLCAVIAANMSTMDSQVLVAGSIVSEDIFRKVFKKGLNSSQLFTLSRIGVIGVSAFATVFALLFKEHGILEIVNYAWSGLGATFGPCVIAALFATRINRYGIIMGILFGGLTAALWPVFGPLLMESICLMPIIPGFIVSWIVMEITSYFTSDKAKHAG